MRKFTRAYFRQAALAGAEAMTPEQRRGRAKAAAQARWAKAQLPTGNDNVATNRTNRATDGSDAVFQANMDVLLARVGAGVAELTMDCADYIPTQVQAVLDAVEQRGLSAGFDGRFCLIRDLRTVANRATNTTNRATDATSKEPKQ